MCVDKREHKLYYLTAGAGVKFNLINPHKGNMRDSDEQGQIKHHVLFHIFQITINYSCGVN